MWHEGWHCYVALLHKLPNRVMALPHVAIPVIYVTSHCQRRRPHEDLTMTISRSASLPPTSSREGHFFAPGWPLAKPLLLLTAFSSTLIIISRRYQDSHPPSTHFMRPIFNCPPDSNTSDLVAAFQVRC